MIPLRDLDRNILLVRTVNPRTTRSYPVILRPCIPCCTVIPEKILRKPVIQYRFNNVPVNVMNNDLWKTVVEKLVDLCTRTKQEQNEIDSLYTQLCESLTKEMDSYLKYAAAPKSTHKRFKNQKPSWNEQLSELWRDMNKKEHIYNKCKGSRREKLYTRNSFINSRKVFDKELRHADREYNKQVLNEIENVSITLEYSGIILNNWDLGKSVKHQ